MTKFDFGHAIRDFAGNKLSASQRAFVVEQDATRAKDVVTLSVVNRHPVGIQLSHAVGASRVERRGFNLRDGLHLAKHLGGAGLIKTNLGID